MKTKNTVVVGYECYVWTLCVYFIKAIVEKIDSCEELHYYL